MRFRRNALVALALASLLACGGGEPAAPMRGDGGDGGDGGGGGGGGGGPTTGSISATVVDPTGDTFDMLSDPWDLTALTIRRDTAGITAELSFSRDVISPVSGDAAATVALLDLDLDQDPATGRIAWTDLFRPPGGHSTGLGVDRWVNLLVFAADGSVAVLDADNRVRGRVTPVFAGRRITIRIPRALLANDDGFVNAAAIVGMLGRPTDLIPESGHLTLERPGE